jgi:hypothetical protein
VSFESLDLQAIFDRVKAGGSLSPEDLQILAAAFRSRQITIATGDRAASIGGNADGAVVITGNGNLVIAGANAESIRDLLGATGSQPLQPGISTDRISQQSAAISDRGNDLAQPMNFNKRQRLEKQSQTLQSEWSTRTDKLKRLRTALAIEAGEAIKFQLEAQIKAEETEIEALEKQLSEIEDTLNAGGQTQPEKK